MRTTEEQHNERKREIMEKCFECYAENGLTGKVRVEESSEKGTVIAVKFPTDVIKI